MKTKAFLSASRLVIMVLALSVSFCFTACGGDDDELSVDELLSDKTTPVTFELAEGDYYMFDYSGNRYVGSDTIHVGASGKCEIDLRQGKHKILWVRTGNSGRGFEDIYNPATHTFISTGGCQSLSYGWVSVDVSPYLLPAQKTEFEYLTAALQIEPTDELPFTPEDNGNYVYEGMMPVGVSYRFVVIGDFTGLPHAQSVSVNNGSCVFEGEVGSTAIAAAGIFSSASQELVMLRKSVVMSFLTLCPTNGIADIQITSTVYDNTNHLVSTTPIPLFSLQCGYTTILRGPLFSGSTADWTVTMESYRD